MQLARKSATFVMQSASTENEMKVKFERNQIKHVSSSSFNLISKGKVTGKSFLNI